MSRLRQALQYRLEYGLVRLAQVLDRILGPRRSDALATALGRFVYRRLRIRAAVTEDQLRHAFPDRPEAWVAETAAGVYEHFAREAMRVIRLAGQGAEAVRASTEVEGLDELREAMARGRGAVLYAGHMGNWELMASALSVRGIPLTAVARRLANPLVGAMIGRARSRLGLRVIFTGGALQGSLEALEAGHVVALVADQDARSRGVFVPFFGRPASTFRGPALVADKAGAPLFVATSRREENGVLRVRLREVVLPDMDDPDELHRAVMGQLTAKLEEAVREAPTQYLWQHRRWKTRPPADRAGNGAPASSV